jgi:hypothetical protein
MQSDQALPSRLEAQFLFLLISVWLLNCSAATLSYFPVQFPGYIIVINVSQILTVDKTFLGERIGSISDSLQEEVDGGLRTVLYL